MSLPPEVVDVCSSWLGLVDDVAPGLVVGLHVRGGLGFDEFVPGVSDVDMVAVLARRPSDDDLTALEESHALLADSTAGAPLDGFHVYAEDLALDPDDCPDLPCILHGWFDPAGRFDVTPVGWHELALHSVPVRGELPPVWTDAARLRAFTRDCLTGEWAGIAASLEKFPAESSTDDATWHVLGAARMHHLLVTGEQSAKSQAGRWALATMDERWHPVLRDALRLRGASAEDRALPPSYADPAERGRDVAAFVAHVVASAACAPDLG
ncbi:aminoglycoside adenylyltransferase domain-containing protein [Nocardioides jiangxiensis]|uniref:DUF4111 domain-containing protein n=1 Tax=Nocardioides jiangxiensis TaxID=3064524 RepID=A0ABT9B064_9ACTN|nr:aminoglycoside adenylyltransferase domain-containing protein [Nocardioides sp. WY-20]MDO7867002.1 DUF4111 domain-containing protein [Nocardioides sp. WY-20]